MGLAALFAGVLIVLALAVAILYGTYLGLVRGGQWVWRFLLGQSLDQQVPYSDRDPLSIACWGDKDCPSSLRDACAAFIQAAEGLPCWVANLRAEGKLRPACLPCHRFKVTHLVA